MAVCKQDDHGEYLVAGSYTFESVHNFKYLRRYSK